MKLYSLLVILFASCALCTVINNVRLRDYSSYMVNVITKTINVVEQKGWCNLKLPEFDDDLKQDVLNTIISGQVKFFNGFLISIQQIDIQQSTVQQIWFFNTTSQITTVTVTGTLRMHEVAVGYDVIADLKDGNGSHRYTTTFTHPGISFAFSVIKNVYTQSLDVTVIGTVPVTSRIAVFRPRDYLSDILTTVYNATIVTAAGIQAWGPEVLEPVALDVVTKRVEFPTICYNCPVKP